MRIRFIVDCPLCLSFPAAAWLLGSMLLCGCQSLGKPKAPDSGGVVQGTTSVSGTVAAASASSQPQVVSLPPPPPFFNAVDMDVAEDFYIAGEYKKACKLFGKVADNKRNPPLHAEKARFYEGECKLLEGDYVDAMATFNRLLIDFQYGVYRDKAIGRMFDIANYWLDDTRTQFDMEQEKADGKRHFIPSNFVHFEKSKPFLDEEGHALKMLEAVFYNDPTGPHADKALFMAAYVHFRRGNFREADQILSAMLDNLDKQGRKSEYRDRALELAIYAKRNSVGGPMYDSRKANESLKLVQEARLSSPELAKNRGDFLDKQAAIVRYMQAEKDYEIADFYRRTGHPASAWFYFELVRRRYPDTEFHDKAVAGMKEISGDLAAQQNQPQIAKAARKEWNKIVFGHEPPILAANAKVPTVPGEPAAPPAGAIVPVSNDSSKGDKLSDPK